MMSLFISELPFPHVPNNKEEIFMLRNPTKQKLETLGLNGMLDALEAQDATPDLYRSMLFDERFALVVDREADTRDTKTLTRRLKSARLRHKACLEDVDFRAARGLDKSLVAQLGSGAWLTRRQNILLTGPTGVGKSYLACAFSHRACQLGFSAAYHRATGLYSEAALARVDGKHRAWLRALTRADVLVIDDFGLMKLSDEERTELLEILEDRHERRSTIVTSQLPVEKWFDAIGNPTLADAIMDRLVHNAHKIELKGPTMRKMTRIDPQDESKDVDKK